MSATTATLTGGAIDYKWVTKGVDMIWNNQFDEAEKHFAPTKETSPRAALHFAEVRKKKKKKKIKFLLTCIFFFKKAVFLRSFITADSNDTAEALNRLEKARKLAEHVISTSSSSSTASTAASSSGLLDARVVLGDSLYMTAILQLTRDSKVTGIINLRKSWKAFESTQKALPADAAASADPAVQELVRCVEFGNGIFLWAISIIPKKFLKFVQLVGFKADRDKGLAYLKRAHDGAGVRGPYGTMLLLVNNLLLPRGLADVSQYLAEANTFIEGTTAKYPTGSLFQVMGSHCRRKMCDVDGGVEFMERAIKSCASLKQAPLIYRYELANCLAMKLDFKAAVPLYEELIKMPDFQVRVIAAVQLACCYATLGRHDDANKQFKSVDKLLKKPTSLDKQMAKQSLRFAANGAHFAIYELLYMRRDLVKMTKYMQPFLESLEAAADNTKAKQPVDVKARLAAAPSGLDKMKSGFSSLLGKKAAAPAATAADVHHPDDRASYMLVRGSMLKALGRSDEAMQCFRDIIELKPVLQEKFFVPYALYELGESLFEKGQLKEADAKMRECAKAPSGYDWEDPLKIRLRIVSDQIAAALSAAGAAPVADDDDDDDDDDETAMTDEDKAAAAAAEAD
jgi:tetratricopeptide (TPR) repeat protein